MAVGDEPLSLPEPPPPRPAARQAAVEAALRKFDGAEEASPDAQGRKRPSWTWWTAMGRRPAGALVTAALIAAVGIPAAMIALREQTIAPRAQEQGPASPERDAVADSVPATSSGQAEPATRTPSIEPPKPSSNSEPLSLAPRAGTASSEDELKAFDAPAPIAAPAAAGPAPPPLPPPPTAPAPQVAEQTGTQEIVLTGRRVAASGLQKQRDKRERASSAASEKAESGPTGAFLFRLQSAVRANNKRAIVALVGLPLRVNFDSGPKTYSDRESMERDFDLIFTPRVRQAILDQGADALFENYQGAMIGAGEVWFGQSCANASCSTKNEVRITAVNP